MTLWGEEFEDLSLQRKPRKAPRSIVSPFVHIDGLCFMQGHSWEYFGITGLKRCVVCQINGYCPGCTPVAPLATAQPFYCTAHTQGGQDDIQRTL
jgi:hypothetical protein